MTTKSKYLNINYIYIIGKFYEQLGDMRKQK